MTRFDKALKLATEAHAGQTDKAGKPYIAHPIAVAEIIRSKYESLASWPSYWDFTLEDLLIAALLHDTVEDTYVTLDQIGYEFGRAVRTIVDGVTRRQRIYDTIGEMRKEPYREFVKRAKQHPGSRIVKLADLEHNLGRISQLPAEEQSIRHRYEKAVVELTQEDAVPEPKPRYELKTVRRAVEVLVVDLVENLPDGTSRVIKQLDFGGNATSAVWFGAQKVVEALNKTN